MSSAWQAEDPESIATLDKHHMLSVIYANKSVIP